MKILKKILLVSDSHGQNHNLWRVLEKERPYDMVIHCGDFEDSLTELNKKAGCEVHIVAGNNDYYSDFPQMKIITFGSHKAVLLHGHRQRLYAGLMPLYYLALENEADYVFFGHLHRPIIETNGGVTMLNPGSITYPRQADGRATYMTLDLLENGDVEIHPHII